MRSLLSLTGTALLHQAAVLVPFLSPRTVGAVNIVVGDDPAQFSNVGWTDGVCYRPIVKSRVGDTVEFNFDMHDVHRLDSRDAFESCNFTGATLLAGFGESPHRYTITDDDAAGDGTVYFACGVTSHCSGGEQRLRVDVERFFTPGVPRGDGPVSAFAMETTDDECDAIQNGDTDGAAGGGFNIGIDADNVLRSECTEAELGDDGRYHVSCLSGPATLTPGGVINEARLLHYPYPTDRRVLVGQRTWEFVEGDPVSQGGSSGVIPVPVNQLYVHHLSGRIVLGQGSEGIRRSAPDAPFPPPYGSLTGNEGDLMIFHLIDLREVGDTWLECVECRCRDGNGTYLDVGGGGETGGVQCCTNCTSLEGPTVDYRMRYNVSYSDIEEDEPIVDLLMVTADISPAAGKNIEFDVPSYKDLPEDQRSSDDPFIQRLEIVAPFKEMFKNEFFGRDYDGPNLVKILRCVGHMHIAAVGMWLEDAETGEVLCSGFGTHGTDPATDAGYLISVSVIDYDDQPKMIRADRPVRFVSEYNATTIHTGVMGMWFLFVSGEREVTRVEADLTVEVCVPPTCDITLLPGRPAVVQEAECVDALPDSPACRFGNLCDCEEFVNHPDSTGCGGIFSSNMGDVAVDSMCERHCGCPARASGAPSGGCEDALGDHPVCRFGQICDCEMFVNSAESTGCGGLYVSAMGNVTVDEVCGSYCDACPDLGNELVVRETILEEIEGDLAERCRYATDDCRLALSNLYGCAEGRPGAEDLDRLVRSVVGEHGRRLAIKRAKLGHPSLHRETADEVQTVVECPIETVKTEDAAGADEDTSAGVQIRGMLSVSVVLVVVLYFAT